MSKAKMERDIQKLLKYLDGLPKGLRRKAKPKLRAAAKAVAMRARRDILSGPKSGRDYRGHRASAPGQAPASLTGRLAKSVKWAVAPSGTTALAYTAAPNAHLMEYGAQRRGRGGTLAPRPFLGPALAAEQGAVLKAVEEAVDAALEG